MVVVWALTLQAGCSKWHQCEHLPHRHGVCSKRHWCEHLPHRQSAVSGISVNTYLAGRVQQVASVWALTPQARCSKWHWCEHLPCRQGVVSGVGVSSQRQFAVGSVTVGKISWYHGVKATIYRLQNEADATWHCLSAFFCGWGLGTTQVMFLSTVCF